MIAVVGFEIVLCHSNVDFVGMAAGGYFGSVHKTGSQTSSVERALRLFPSVASGCAVVGGLRPQDLLLFDVCSHTVHATIAILADIFKQSAIQTNFAELGISVCKYISTKINK